MRRGAGGARSTGGMFSLFSSIAGLTGRRERVRRLSRGAGGGTWLRSKDMVLVKRKENKRMFVQGE